MASNASDFFMTVVLRRTLHSAGGLFGGARGGQFEVGRRTAGGHIAVHQSIAPNVAKSKPDVVFLPQFVAAQTLQPCKPVHHSPQFERINATDQRRTIMLDQRTNPFAW